MTKISSVAAGAMLAAVLLGSQVHAQGAPQTVSLVRVDVHQLATGYRASKIVGSKVVNDDNATIGRVDDLIVDRNDNAPFAVLSVGGFLGMGKHLVVVPSANLKFVGNKVVLPGGTKDALKALPAFAYAK